jgi:hypothetical protein
MRRISLNPDNNRMRRRKRFGARLCQECTGQKGAKEMAEVKQSPATSPSKAINDMSKQSWKGGVNHGTQSVKDALKSSPTKHPLSKPSGSKK